VEGSGVFGPAYCTFTCATPCPSRCAPERSARTAHPAACTVTIVSSSRAPASAYGAATLGGTGIAPPRPSPPRTLSAPASRHCVTGMPRPSQLRRTHAPVGNSSALRRPARARRRVRSQRSPPDPPLPPGPCEPCRPHAAGAAGEFPLTCVLRQLAALGSPKQLVEAPSQTAQQRWREHCGEEGVALVPQVEDVRRCVAVLR
jgi:hypothetical protein